MRLWIFCPETSQPPPQLPPLPRLLVSPPQLLLHRYTSVVSNRWSDAVIPRFYVTCSVLSLPQPTDDALDLLAGDFVASSAAPAVNSAPCAPTASDEPVKNESNAKPFIDTYFHHLTCLFVVSNSAASRSRQRPGCSV